MADDESDPEASEFDLGTKIKTPKDVMLEELSLLNNKGSKMFKMRQQRVEKFIVSNENNVGVTGRKGSVCLNLVVSADQTLSSCSSSRRTSRTCSWLLPLFRQNLRSQRRKVGCLISSLCPESIDFLTKKTSLGLSPCVPPLSVSVVEENVDEEAEKKKRRQEYVRTYVSPWERAMKGNEELTATMKPCMPGPVQIHSELPLYKSFNRYRLDMSVHCFYRSSDNESEKNDHHSYQSIFILWD